MRVGLVLGEAFSGLRRNASMVISVVLIIAFFALTLSGKLIPGRMQSLGELSYQFSS